MSSRERSSALNPTDKRKIARIIAKSSVNDLPDLQEKDILQIARFLKYKFSMTDEQSEALLQLSAWLCNKEILDGKRKDFEDLIKEFRNISAFLNSSQNAALSSPSPAESPAYLLDRPEPVAATDKAAFWSKLEGIKEKSLNLELLYGNLDMITLKELEESASRATAKDKLLDYIYTISENEEIMRYHNHPWLIVITDKIREAIARIFSFRGRKVL
ncbi:MAG: hypothetical protein LBU32_14005 [Clostridiales bacterium]|jgi:hypothetical protein|nr:hypothetical protein [Clostridiales bacterium]